MTTAFSFRSIHTNKHDAHSLIIGSLVRAPRGRWLAAVTQIMGVQAKNTVMVSSSMRVLRAGQEIGVECWSVPSRMASLGTFEYCAKMSGFGYGGVRFGKVQAVLQAKAARSASAQL